MKPLSSHIDKAAIGLSLICAVHCLLLPIALVILPTLAASTFSDERCHQWMLIAVLPVSLMALMMGCRRHAGDSMDSRIECISSDPCTLEMLEDTLLGCTDSLDIIQ